MFCCSATRPIDGSLDGVVGVVSGGVVAGGGGAGYVVAGAAGVVTGGSVVSVVSASDTMGIGLISFTAALVAFTSLRFFVSI